MKLFVGCNSKSYILQFTNQSLEPRITVLPSNRISNFGFAWSRGFLYAAESEGLVEYSPDLVKLNVYKDIAVTEPDPWSAEKNKGPGLVSPQFNRVHQLLTINYMVHSIDTGHEMLRRFDTKTKTWLPIIKFKEIPWAREREVNWVNSINCIDGKIYLVSLNHGWSSLLIFDQDMNFLEGVENIGFLAHNVWKMHGKLWTSSSGEGYVQVIKKHSSRFAVSAFQKADPTPDETGITELNIGGYVRGVAMSDHYLFLGITQIRNSNTPDIIKPGIMRPPRPLNSILGLAPDFGVALFDLQTLKFLKFIPLSDADAVLELRLMDERDYAVHVDEGNEIFSFNPIGFEVSSMIK